MPFSLLQYIAAFLLGVLVSVLLSCAQPKAYFARKLVLICGVLLTAQLLSYHFWGLSVTKKLYPLIVHFPLWVLMVLLLKTPKAQTAVSILMAYMCCQPPRWIASLGLLISEEHWLYQILYIPIAGLFLFLLWRYLATPIRQFIERSRKACLMMGLVPALYYIFDYGTTIYTSLLTSGNAAAVQFMPSVVSIAYLLFIFMYNLELEKQMQLSMERDFLSAQLLQSKVTLSTMQQMQEKTMQYRHDMRHHFALLQALAAENNIVKIQQYLNIAQHDIEDMTPVQYCGNEVVNLLLSYYAAAAKDQNVEFTVVAALPPQLPYSETELCSLLSNGLENAIYAASLVPPPKKRQVSIHMGIHCDNLLIQIENTYTGDLFWQDGLPCTNRKEHGLGTKSIRAIVRSHGGDAIFRAQHGLFQLRIMLPNHMDETVSLPK